ncbi:MAG: hypothetical protein K0R26_1965 [Bacteroidota bacterium]|jgi:hypothetical protein|nr:hypothetical protein [Bacteroidota bacterium]
MRYSFSGHESFHCRHLWLKKGYDFINNGKSFSDESAVLELGVGKNMVNSIRFWMKAFNILDEKDSITPLANRLFNDRNGWDKYIEDEATLWLLHYHLVKKSHASTYNMIFNEFRKEKIEFTRINFENYVQRKSDEIGFAINKNTIRDDFDVFLKMYLRPDSQSKDRDDSYSGILSELEFVQSIGRGENKYFVIENSERPEIPDEIILYCILENGNFESSLNLSSIEQEYDSVGSIFAINRSGLFNKIEGITEKFKKEMHFSDHAGVRELQFKTKPDPLTILERYYAN